MLTIHRSALDASVNWEERSGPRDAVEYRYVRRSPEKATLYLSSQTGCNQGCRMCHLTATGQNRPRNLTASEIVDQARVLMDHVRATPPLPEKVHLAFMARGEPLLNPSLTRPRSGLVRDLVELSGATPVRVLISTIMPRGFATPLRTAFPGFCPDIYWSAYTADDEWRSRWLPRAQRAVDAIGALVRWQQDTGKIPRVHYALIAGENDSDEDAVDLASLVDAAGLRVDVNLVRYNPPPGNGRESDRYDAVAAVWRALHPRARVKVVDRVGFDVQASCGMFTR